MGALRCPQCGQARARRCHREGVLEHALSAFYVYPYRCQLCARRFRALQWGKRYAKQAEDRREYERVPLRAPLVAVSGGTRIEGEMLDLSVQGCTARTRTPLRAGANVRLEIELEPGAPPVVVAAALVKSVGTDRVGLYFIGIGDDETLRIRRALTALHRATHDAGVPPAPPIRADGRLQFLRSTGFWVTALVLVLAALVLTVLFPTFSRCVWGVTC